MLLIDYFYDKFYFTKNKFHLFMKTLSRILFAFILIAGLASCKSDSKAQKAGEAASTAKATVTSKTYTVSPAESSVTWVGSKKIGGASHNGTIKLTSGSLAAEGGKITSGNFVIDMTSITNVDLAGSKMAGKLEGHLKNEDFFDVANHPTAKFTITSVAPLAGNDSANYTINGNLTMKGVEKNISFPAMVAVIGDKISATAASFAINRTDWGIKYGSEASFADLAKDKVISDDINLTIGLMASSGMVK